MFDKILDFIVMCLLAVVVVTVNYWWLIVLTLYLNCIL